MTSFRFIHASDLHLGKRFSNIADEGFRGRLQEARHGAIDRLAAAARSAGAAHVLVAGDVFDTETPSEAVWRQALARMGEDPAIAWWLLPGNHDSLAAETLWDRLARLAPPNVHPLLEAAPVAPTPGVTLLPAPPTRRYPGRDLTAWFADCPTPEGDLRLGLAHGAIRDFSEDGSPETIPPDRAATARLDYLALGDWHGRIEVGARTWYCGTPERDSFKHGGRGGCLGVTLAGPGAAPEVAILETGLFHWAEIALPLLPGQDAAAALEGALPIDAGPRRDCLLRLRATGRASLAERAALEAAAAHAAPEFGFFELDTAALGTEYEATDLDQIDRGGALRAAAEALKAEAGDPALTERERGVAAAALNRLYGILREEARG